MVPTLTRKIPDVREQNAANIYSGKFKDQHSVARNQPANNDGSHIHQCHLDRVVNNMARQKRR